MAVPHGDLPRPQRTSTWREAHEAEVIPPRGKFTASAGRAIFVPKILQIMRARPLPCCRFLKQAAGMPESDKSDTPEFERCRSYSLLLARMHLAGGTRERVEPSDVVQQTWLEAHLQPAMLIYAAASYCERCRRTEPRFGTPPLPPTAVAWPPVAIRTAW
jgi:hypothetical protein